MASSWQKCDSIYTKEINIKRAHYKVRFQTEIKISSKSGVHLLSMPNILEANKHRYITI